MTTLATPEMATYCCQVILSQLQKDAPKPQIPKSIPNTSAPLFVCLKKLNGELRGCIGTFEHAPIQRQLEQYAINAAFNDRRFNPVRESDLKDLKCTVSLLHSFEKTAAWNDWEVGKHGIRINILNGKYGATYLPTVASEQGWNHSQALQSLIKKAGCTSPINVERDVVVERYQESSFCVNFADVL